MKASHPHGGIPNAALLRSRLHAAQHPLAIHFYSWVLKAAFERLGLAGLLTDHCLREAAL